MLLNYRTVCSESTDITVGNFTENSVKILGMNSYAERLEYAIRLAGSSQAELARQAGIKQQSVQYLCSNEKAQGSKYTTVFAEILNVSAGWLATGKGPIKVEPEPSNVSPGPAIRGMVPLISWVSAGRWREPDISLDAPLEWLPVTFKTPNVFGLRVEGDSMEPDYPPGTIIFVDPDRSPEPMNLVVARNGDDEATFKRLTREGGVWYLTPLNPRYPLQKLDSLCKVIGVVIMASRWTA